MQLILLENHVMQSIVLPQKVSGKFFIKNSYKEDLVTLEPNMDKSAWELKVSYGINLIAKTGETVEQILCTVGDIFKVKDMNNTSKGLILVESADIGSRQFIKYSTDGIKDINLGADANNDIIIDNPYVSRQHAQIKYVNSQITAVDLNSSNGLYLNNRRITQSNLKFGDVLYILGVMVIVGNGFIAINNPSSSVQVSDALRLYQKDEKTKEQDNTSKNVIHFSRSPRFISKIKEKQIKIEAPPQIQNPEGIPMLFMIGPSITMGMSSMLMAYFTLSSVLTQGRDLSQALPTLSMSVCMMLGMVLWPVLTKKFEKRRKDGLEALRQEKYKKYLGDILSDIKETTKEQKNILLSNYYETERYIESIRQQDNLLWNRQYQHGDFMNVRLGLGTLPLNADFKYPEKKFTLEDDNLQNLLEEIIERPKKIDKVPIMYSLIEHFVSGIVGTREQALRFTKDLLFQLLSMHSYDELKVVVLCDDETEDVWNFVKWLPHCFSRDLDLRFFLANEEDSRAISVYLDEILAARKDFEEKNIKNIEEHYLIIADSEKLTKKSDIIKHILERNKKEEVYAGYSVLFISDHMNSLPKECTSIIELEGDTGSVFEHYNITEDDIKRFEIESILYDYEDVIAKKLMNIRLDTYENKFQLPNTYTFMDMYKASKVEHLNILSRWQENNPVHSLKAPIGIDEYGDMFSLDLHEKHHGPHGLIAGMTGSGKSEFIITYILSVALNYSPLEVAFILIDFKGGGMADTFKTLPHVAGKITNLDDGMIVRSLVSIESELKRRQRIFNKASELLGISNIDIYKYQQLFREGSVHEPVQHLIIISDEFAELKAQQPEFMEQLISTARIGRSLGVHLVLATQKPSGVVNDQIWSNSKFRVCLKVQEKADSMEMLKRPEAASLTQAGRYYLQVGYNELFEMGQSAWAGAMYMPSDIYEEECDKSAYIIDKIGRILIRTNIEKNTSLGIKQEKQVDAITKYLSSIAMEERLLAKPLWLEPLPEIIVLDDISMKFDSPESECENIAPVIGMLDDPENQEQRVLTVPISENGNVIIYGAGDTGKTTFITTMIYSVITTKAPQKVNIYILDFGNQTLLAFRNAPHIGDVVLRDENEKIESLLRQIEQEVENRRQLFSNYGGNLSQYKRMTGKEMPSIIIVINDFVSFREKSDIWYERVSKLTDICCSYGVYFVITTTTTRGIGSILPNFGQMFTLRFNEDTRYREIFGRYSGVKPKSYKGRGLIKLDDVYEYQVARVTDNLESTYEFIQSICGQLQLQNKAYKAKRVQIMPKTLFADYFKSQLDDYEPWLYPVGLDHETFEPVSMDLSQACVYQIGSVEPFNNKFAQGLIDMMDLRHSSFKLLDMSYTMGHNELSKGSLEKAVMEIFDDLVLRNNTYKDALESGSQVPTFEETIIIINGFDLMLNELNEALITKRNKTKEDLEMLLLKNEKQYNVRFVLISSARGISSFSSKSWYIKHCRSKINLWIGDGISQNQGEIKLTKYTPFLREDIGEDYGYIISHNKAKRIRIIEGEV